jgi:hypothetical protein
MDFTVDILPQEKLLSQASRHTGVRFIFLHTPLLEPQGWREGV